VQHGIDAEHVSPDPAGDRLERHHLPHDGLVGKPSADHADEHECDLREPQAEQPEVDEAELEGHPKDRMPRRALRGVFVGLPARNRDAGHVVN
jgi:hypothetical protein